MDATVAGLFATASLGAAAWFGVRCTVSLLMDRSANWRTTVSDGGLAVLSIAMLALLYMALRLSYRRYFVPQRLKRLHGIAAHPQAASRLPHRLLEFEYRRRKFFSLTRRDMLRFIAPGQVVALGIERLPSRIEWCGHGESFEPIEIRPITNGLKELVALTGSPDPLQLLGQPVTARIKAARKARKLLGAMLAIVGIVLLWQNGSLPMLATNPIGAWRGILLGVLLPAMFLTVLVGMPLLILHLRDQFFMRRTYIVPGGFAWVTHRIGQRETLIERATAQDSPLLIGSGGVLVSCGGKPRGISLALCRDAAVSNWLSDARTPTMEELRAYFSAERAEMGGRRSVV